MSLELNKLRKYDGIEKPICYNSQLFLEYIKSFGFDPKNYRRILELNQTPEKSMTRIMELDKSYLLSKKVTKYELNKYHINGFYGYLAKRGIVIPRCIANDEIILKGKVSRAGKGYNHPTLSKYDVIISNGIPEDGFELPYDKNLFLGFAINNDFADADKKLEELKQIREKLISLSGKDYRLEQETTSTENMKLCLIRRVR